MIGRTLARTLTDDELAMISGGTEDPGPPVETLVRTNIGPNGDTEKQLDPRMGDSVDVWTK
jgi:hypothetical protein